MFLLELCRDYFFLFSSRKATDLNLIRHFTKSLKIVNINNFIGYTFQCGCGDLNIEAVKKEYLKIVNLKMLDENKISLESFINDYKNLLSIIQPPKFLDYNFVTREARQITSDNPQRRLLINVPSNFLPTTDENLLGYYGLKAVVIPKEKVPQSLLDLKSFINSRTVSGYNDLSNKINLFNIKKNKIIS